MLKAIYQRLYGREQLRAAAGSAAFAIERAGAGSGGGPELRLLPPPTAVARAAARELANLGVWAEPVRRCLLAGGKAKLTAALRTCPRAVWAGAYVDGVGL